MFDLPAVPTIGPVDAASLLPGGAPGEPGRDAATAVRSTDGDRANPAAAATAVRSTDGDGASVDPAAGANPPAAAGADAGPALLVDVRERNEFLDVRVPGALLYPVSSFTHRFMELPRDRPLLVICAHGNRSAAVTVFLLRNGFADVRSVHGGMEEWVRAGLPHRRGPLQADEGPASA